MNHNEETFQTWNKVAQAYQDKFMELELYNDSYDSFCKAIHKADARILDLGCGPGNITRYLLTKNPGYKILGFDIAPNMIKLAKQNNPGASFQVMDIREIGKMEAEYDGIICGFSLPYLSPEESLQLISDTYDLLTEKGVLYLSFVEGDPTQSGFQTASTGDRSYFHYHNLSGFTEHLQYCGFHELVTFNLEYNRSETEREIHTIIIAKK
ncbi:MAG: class I SAM-dependent methyltransferase [Chitinophagaceae bacterium]|nr:class I SAM-dependent methyltransferase [Chitinophagaceae bacterium]